MLLFAPPWLLEVRDGPGVGIEVRVDRAMDLCVARLLLPILSEPLSLRCIVPTPFVSSVAVRNGLPRALVAVAMSVGSGGFIAVAVGKDDAERRVPERRAQGKSFFGRSTGGPG